MSVGPSSLSCMTLRVIPAADAGWDAVQAVFASEASARNCWCQFHVLENATARATDRDGRRDLLRAQVEELDPPRGLIAIDGGEPVGWCGVEPRMRLRHVLASRLVTGSSPDALDDPGVWAVYCLLVPPRSRRRGIAASMLRAAVAHALVNGATSIEGYPIDTAQRGGKLPPGFSTGTVSMFEQQEFRRVAVLPSARTLMHRADR